jgi:hypothetical protein
MADLDPEPGTGAGTGAGGRRIGIARWVRVTGLAAVLAGVLVVAAIVLLGGDGGLGGHGPRQHGTPPAGPQVVGVPAGHPA